MSFAGYSNADWAGNADDRKAPLEVFFFFFKLSNNFVSWDSKKLSIVEAKYITASSCCFELL